MIDIYTHIFSIFAGLLSFVFILYTIASYFAKKNKRKIYLAYFFFGNLITYFFATLRLYFANNASVDYVLWLVSVFGGMITLFFFVILCLDLLKIKKKKKYSYWMLLYIVLMYSSFIVLPATRVELKAGVEWVPGLWSNILLLPPALLLIFLAVKLMITGFKSKRNVPVLFGVGSVFSVIGLILDASGFQLISVSRFVSAVGFNIMFYSILMIEDRKSKKGIF